MELTPDDLSLRDRYKLMIGTIVPRPIALVSTVSTDGRDNLAPFSFFTGIGSDPMTLLFCPGNKPDGTDKDTLKNCLPMDEGGTGEFVVNVVQESYADRMALTAEPLPFGDSEFDLAGFDRTPSTLVQPPRLAASPVAYECRTTRIVRTNPGAPGGGNVVFGDVVRVHVDDELIDDRFHVDPDRLGLIGRMGGFDYCRTTDRLTIRPGKKEASR